jgi:hypothetical protein
MSDMRKPPGFKPTELSNVVTIKSSGSEEPKRESEKVTRKSLKKKFPKLFGLRCWDMAQDKIKAGIALEEVGRWIQDDMLEYRDSKRESLVRALYRFKSELPPEEIVTDERLHLDEKIEKAKRNVSELEELEKLYLLQLHRIDMDVRTEDKINKLFKSTSNEIKLAQDLLVKRMELKMKMGIVSTAPTEYNVNQSNVSVNAHAVVSSGVDALGLDEERKMKLGALAAKLVMGMKDSTDNEIKQAADSMDKPLN